VCVRACVCVCVVLCFCLCWILDYIGIGLEVYNDQKEQEESLLDFF
jgi:hypothetical protein